MPSLLGKKHFSPTPHDDDAYSSGNFENRRRFFNIKSFVFVSGVLMCTQSALSMYTKGVLTSIERQFQISSSLSGLLVGSFNVGNVLFVVLISKLCSKGNRPRSMAIGALVTAVGGFLNAIPHAITPLYDPTDISNISSSSDEAGQIYDCGNSKSYMFIFAGEMLQGIGAAALVPLGSSYVDDYAKEGRTPLYIGIMLFLQNMGPGIGFLMGSFTTTLYVDFDRLDAEEVPINSEDKNWIGAWWFGYMIIGVLVIFSSIPLFWFPKSLPSEGGGGKSSVKICGTFITVQRLLCDPLYLCVIMGYSALMFTVGTLTTFMPKFLETVFYQSKSRASFIFGMSMPLVLCLGLVSGGLIVQKAGLKTRGKMIFACVISAVTILLCTFAYLVTCDVSSDIDCFQVGDLEANETSCSRLLEAKCSSSCYIFVAVVSLAALLSCHIITPYYSVILRYSFLHIIFTGIAFTFFFNLLGYFAQRHRGKSLNNPTNKDTDMA